MKKYLILFLMSFAFLLSFDGVVLHADSFIDFSGNINNRLARSFRNEYPVVFNELAFDKYEYILYNYVDDSGQDITILWVVSSDFLNDYYYDGTTFDNGRFRTLENYDLVGDNVYRAFPFVFKWIDFEFIGMVDPVTELYNFHWEFLDLVATNVSLFHFTEMDVNLGPGGLEWSPFLLYQRERGNLYDGEKIAIAAVLVVIFYTVGLFSFSYFSKRG